MVKILDTNFIYSLFNAFDSNHQAAKEILFGFDEADEIKIPFIVAAELAVNPDAGKLLQGVSALASKFSKNNESDLEFISSLPPKTKQKLRANDCLILSLCQRYKAELVSFDKALVKLNRPWINWSDPIFPSPCSHKTIVCLI